MTRDAEWCRIVLDGDTIAEGIKVSAEEQSDIQVIHSIGSESPIHVPNRSWVDVNIGALWWSCQDVCVSVCVRGAYRS